MNYLRKSFDSKWFTFKLSKEETATVEKVTVTRGLRMLQLINKIAGENGMKLSDTDKAALMNWSALTYESFASDLVEANEAARKAAEAAPAAQ